MGVSLNKEDIALVLVSGATANVACLKRLGYHNCVLKRFGVPACAGFDCGHGRMEEIRFAADAPLGLAGRRIQFATFLVDADIPARLLRGVLESLGAKLDFARNGPL